MKNWILSLVTLTLIISGCGGDNTQTDKKAPQETPPAPQESNEVKTNENATEIALVLSSNDQMKYDKKELRAREGQQVNLTLKHTGSMSKKVMGHNFVLLKKGTNVATFAQQAMQAKDNEYIPEGDAVIAHTKLIGGGESTTVTFTAPAAGTYDFICSFPGHFGIMKGKFIVE